jgi:hypothetical protein
VAQGLAVRAGVLMGVDTGRLKDLLLLDVAPKSLGIITLEPSSSNSNSNSNSNSKKDVVLEQVFEPVLHKGTRLPARGVCRFRLEGPRQRFVTATVYEEVELLEPAPSSSESSDSDFIAPAFDLRYDYRFICSYDFPVADFPVQGDGGERFAYVEITMSEGGDIGLRVLSDPHGGKKLEDGFDTDPQRRATNSELSQTNSPTVWMLVVYIGLLAALYLAVKLFVVEPPSYASNESVDQVIGVGEEL